MWRRMEDDRHLGLQLKPIVLQHMKPKAIITNDESNERIRKILRHGLQSSCRRVYNLHLLILIYHVLVTGGEWARIGRNDLS
jgi:hypothetical protein